CAPSGAGAAGPASLAVGRPRWRARSARWRARSARRRRRGRGGYRLARLPARRRAVLWSGRGLGEVIGQALQPRLGQTREQLLDGFADAAVQGAALAAEQPLIDGLVSQRV